MYIIVVGGGRLGYHLLKGLLNEGHETLVLEKDPRICRTIIDELGSVCYRGDGCEAATLAEVGCGRADMLVAVTGDDEDNLVSCQVAKYKYNVPRTIARIRNPQNAELFKKLGVDVTVSATDIIMKAIERELPTHPLTELLSLEEKGLVIVDVKIQPDSSVIGKSLKELNLPRDSKMALILPYDGEAYVPNNSTILRAGDHLIAVTTEASKEALKTILKGSV
jgi:trk system potassium uptake protein TrkA